MPPRQAEPLAIRTPAFSRRELVMLAVVISVGVALRLVAFSRSAVEHFDEGVYASNIYFGPPDYAYPQQRFFAPPLLPALIEAGMIAGLPPNIAAIFPSFIAGCATIVALWWFGRSWFGFETGLAAATLVAFNDFHIVYSATALTDVVLGLWLVMAIYAVARSLAHADFRWAVVAGILVGLAWWTKYNGWLPLAIEAVELPLLWFVLRPPLKQLWSWIGCATVTAMVAIAVWSPYYLSLQSNGGYGPIAENHARYFVGAAGWFDAATRQMSNQYAIGLLSGYLGLALALLLPHFLSPRSLREVWRLIATSISGTLGWIVVTGGMPVSIGAGRGLIRTGLAARGAQKWDAPWKFRLIGLVTVLTWWISLLVITPMYTPYLRITLPCTLAAFLAAAINWSACGRANEEAHFDNRWHYLFWPFVICMWISASLFLPHEETWQLSHDRRTLQHIAQQVHERTEQGGPRVVYVFGEPAMFFQLRVAGEEFVAPVQNIPQQAATMNDQAVPTFLIFGPHAQTDPQFKQQWAGAEDQWQLLETFDYTPSAIVWLDLHDPRRPADAPANHSIRVYRLRD